MLGNIFNRFSRLIRETPAEIYIGAALGMTLGAAVAFNHEAAKRGQIPLAFSELSQLKKQAQDTKEQLSSLSLYYATLNDLLMQVFEANNTARNGFFGEWSEKFAFELEKKIERTMRFHHQIPEYSAELPGYAAASLRLLDTLAQARADLPPIVEALRDSWDENHDDIKKTVHYKVPVCVTNKKGREICHDKDKTREEYDYTIHTYRYYGDKGRRAARLMQAFTAKYPDLKMNLALATVGGTNAENEWAIRESRRLLPGYKAPDGKEYVRLANVWATGSNYAVLVPRIHETQPVVNGETHAWIAAEPYAHGTRYKTHSHDSDGPQEFQVAQKAFATTAKQLEQLSTLIDGIVLVRDGIGPLDEKIKVYVNAALHRGPGDPARLGGEVLSKARNMYEKNYVGGFDVYPAQWGMAVLYTLLAGALGGGLGKRVDLWGNRRGRAGAIRRLRP